jgi:hypothetical protein
METIMRHDMEPLSGILKSTALAALIALGCSSGKGGDEDGSGDVPDIAELHDEIGADPDAAPDPADALPDPAEDLSPGRRFALPLEADAAGHARRDGVAEIHLDFTSILEGLGQEGDFDDGSILVFEVDGSGAVIDGDVAFQFDRDPDYDAAVRAAGTLVFLVKGETGAEGARTYRVLFDTAGTPFPPPAFDPLVTIDEGAEDEGQASFMIGSAGGTLFLQTGAGGFSSFVDSDGSDWIGFNPEPGSGSAGEYRGIPNAVYPEGYFHPGSTDLESEVITRGPLKITVRSVTADGLWECRWEFYPGHATMTMLSMDHDFWLLYEGTPGGSLDPDTDFMVRSDGTQTPLSESWNGDLEDEEWIFVADPALGRSIFLAHHEDDAFSDIYRPMEGNMTVFGFGRSDSPLTSYLSDLPQRLSVGLLETTDTDACAAAIRANLHPMVVTAGAAEEP